jgi:hypothetical protein
MDAGAQVGPGTAMPSDFNFIFQYGHGRILDTSKGTFTRDAAVPKYSLTVDFKLTVMENEGHLPWFDFDRLLELQQVPAIVHSAS